MAVIMFWGGLFGLSFSISAIFVYRHMQKRKLDEEMCKYIMNSYSHKPCVWDGTKR